MRPSRDITRLIEIMAALRTPGTGCAWDLAQTPESIVPYTIEETYEVAEAVARGDADDLRDELGDLLLQVVFQARMAEEAAHFDFGDVVIAITSKLIRRHPHIFGDRRDLTPNEVKQQWEAVKAAEKTARRSSADGAAAPARLLEGVAAGLPALLRATKLQSKAATVGFDWDDPRRVVAKIREEVDEAEVALDDREALPGEIGDLLFAVVNLARHAGVDPEVALRGANAKFERRFGEVERGIESQGGSLLGASLAEMEAFWQKAKEAERDPEALKGIA